MMRGVIQDNIILVNKPKGPTSFDVVRKIRQKLKVKKVGHAGTLDPMAEGLLIVGIGAGTKKLGDFLKLPKTYDAKVLFGIRTDTGDITGMVLERKVVPKFDEEKFNSAVESMVGKHSFPVPAYSAIKMAGQPLYKRARAGETFDLPIKEMEIIHVSKGEMRSIQGGYEACLTIRVSSGTYIRSIVQEIGRLMDLPATLLELKRTSIGNYLLEDAVRVEDVELLP